jgi:hypothetical protein
MNSLQKVPHLLIFLSLFFLGNKLLGQSKTLTNSFVIHGEVSGDKKKFYTTSIEKSNLEPYRLKTEKVVLKFKNGFLLELIPAKELVIKNIASEIDLNNYSDRTDNLNYKNPIFQVLDSGWLTAEIQTNSK